MSECAYICMYVCGFVFVCVRCPPTFEINAAVCILAWRSVNCVNCATQHVCHNNRVYMGHMWLPLPQLGRICATVVAVRLGHCVHVCGLKPLLRAFGCFVRPTASQSLMQLVQPLPSPFTYPSPSPFCNCLFLSRLSRASHRATLSMVILLVAPIVSLLCFISMSFPSALAAATVAAVAAAALLLRCNCAGAVLLLLLVAFHS